MADRRVQYTLAFSADTKQAKAQLASLQNQITGLINSANTNNASGLLSKEIHDASVAAAQLKVQLQGATNATTGKLDLTKFNQSLLKSGMTIDKYKQSLLSLGPDGAQAFANLATSISQAEMPMFRLGEKAKDLVNTLSNTVKWQISSSAIHGFMGAIQGAYGYAQDLNKSLNDIRIVTGQSTDQMAEFAKQANNSAKALSTSTVKYAEAALIYYQQGLSDEQVKARTDTTIKMANVTGENAADVSSYMTAIWNNFAEGSDNLEYFSDVITALGAATAASSEEIAGGLEKFAAVGETVGLSYEYATAALTTIIDKTRQSEDVVGTALKTIFARIQGLQQGDTTDDGVTLNKYSAALANVGIQIMDTSGNLKDMDKILDELGQKWTTLSKAEQVALAQTVGGTRQYTQLIALMENWGAMQENLNIAYNSEGALQEQADIYAESWEAAQKRVTAALQDIYDSLLNDKFFIGINNTFASLLNITGDLIDGLGGFKGILLTLGVVAIKFFKGNLIDTINNARDTLFSFTSAGRKEIQKLRTQANDALKTMYEDASTPSGYAIGAAYASQADAQDALIAKTKNLSEEQRKVAQILLDQHKTLVANVLEQGKLTDKAEQTADKALRQWQLQGKKDKWEGKSEAKSNYVAGVAAETFLGDTFGSVDIGARGTEQQIEELEKVKNIIDGINKSKLDLNQTIFGGKGDAIVKQIKDLSLALNNPDLTPEEKFQKLTEMIMSSNKAVNELKKSAGHIPPSIKKEFENLGINIGQLGSETIRASSGVERLKEKLNNLTTEDYDKFANKIINIGSVLGQISMVITGFKSLNEAWDMDQDIKLTDRLTQSISSLTMLLPAAAGLMKLLTSETGMNTLATSANAVMNFFGATSLHAFGKAEIVAATGATTLKLALWEIFLIVGVVAAALGALVFIGKKIYEWFNKDKIALEKANEELENSKKAADNASAAYDDLKSSIDSLESAQNTLSNLTKGTLEWKEAVLKVNQQVLDLIEKYPELAQYMTNTDGVLGISEEGLDKVVQKQLNAAYATQSAVLSDQRNLAQTRANQENKLKSIDVLTIDQNTKEQTKKVLDTNAQIAMVNNAEKVGAFKDGQIDFYKLAKEMPNLYGDFLLYQNAINDTIPEILAMREAIDKTTLEMQKMDENIAKNWLNNHKTGYDKDYNDFLAKGMGQVAGDIRKNLSTSIGGLGDKEVKQAYAKMILGAEATETAIDEYIKELDKNKVSVETMKESLLDTAVNLKALEAVEGRVAGLSENLEGQAGYNTLKNIVTSGGDEASFNALTETQAEELRALLFNEGVQTELQQAFADESIFGENFLQNLKNKIGEANSQAAEDYAIESANNREKLFSQKAGERASSLGVDEEAFEAYARSLQDTNSELKDNIQATLDAAEANIRWNKGITKLSDVLSDNEDALKDANKGTWEYYEALGKVEEAASELLGIDVSTEYVEKHMEDFKKAAKGDEEAIKNLQKTAASDWGKTFAEGLKGVNKEYKDFEGNLKTFDGSTWAGDFTTALDQVNEKLGSMDTSFELDANTDPALQSLVDLTNEALLAGEMTEDQMREMFGSMGYTPEVTYVEGPGNSYTDKGSFTIGDPDSMFHMTIPYVNSYTSSLMVPQIKDSSGDNNKTVSFTKTTTAKSLAKTATPTAKGGSGGGSKKEGKEIERYHTVNKELESMRKQLDAVAKAKDRAFSEEDRLKAMEKEIALYDQIIAKEKEKLALIEKDLTKDKASLEKFGAQIDPNTGAVLNYEELMKKWNNQLESGKMSQEKYDERIKALEQWEETWALWEDQAEKVADEAAAKISAELANIELKAEIKLKFNDQELEYLDYLLSRIEDKSFSAAKRMALLGDQTKTTLDKYDVNVEKLYDLMKQSGLTLDEAIAVMTGTASKDILDKLNDEQEEAFLKLGQDFMKVAQDLDNLKQETSQGLIDAIQEGIDAFDEIGEKIDHVTGTLEHYKNIIDIIGQDTLGVSTEQMLDMMQTAVDSSVASLANAQETLTYLQAQRKAIEDSDLPEDEKNKQLKDIDAKIRDAEASVQSGLEGVLSTIVEQFSTSLELATKEFEKSMSGAFGSLEKLQEAFDRQKEIDDLYVDDYKKIYELTKLTRDINKSIDETDNIKAKQALRDLQKEINDLQKDGTQLSEYDIEMLNKKYELRLAEIALEDAQNAKSQVRMTRDSEGNWSYTYTADENSIAEAEQNYEDKLYAAQEANQEYIKNLQDQIISSYAAMMQAIKQLGPDATQEEINAIRAHYEAIMEAQTQQMENAMSDSNEILGFMKSETEGWINSFDETTLSALTGYQTMEEYQNAFGAATTKMMSDIAAAMTTYQTNIKTAMDTCGLSVEDFGKRLETVLNGEGGIKDQIDGLETETTTLVDTVSNNVSTALDSLAGFYSTYSEKVALATAETWGLKEAIQALIDAEPDKPEEEPEPEQDPKPEQPTGPTWSRVKSAYNKIHTGAWGTGAKRYSDGKADGYTEAEIKMAQKLINLVYGGMSMEAAKTKLGFFTGGYTGEWGASGKLAFLHEKELVLNADDTQNMLKSIEMVRAIAQTIDLNSGSTLGWGGLSSMGVGNGKSEIVQDITINAEFPNATDQNEIKAAFDSLFIRASQYANRK